MRRPGRYVRLCVADTGEGMDEATLSRIFEPFFTTKKAGSGSGLGLAMVHSIIVQSGGYISAGSQVGRGTTFEILLPCTDTLRRLDDPSKSLCSAEKEPSSTVLLVDDEDGVRRLMHNFLEGEGYRLLEARDAHEAQDIAERYADPIHILVSDIVMPGMTGTELARKLVPQRPEMKVLFVSGYPHDAVVHQPLANRRMPVLQKPFGRAEFLRQVETLLSSENRVQ
jgi:two-component system, cell cycle sensor histidine kinase and response regulator CckA